jgi:tetratricopeptide (TPR) repeat protein
VPEDVDPRSLERSVRAELRSLSKATADAVAGHLVAAGLLVDTDPAGALAHAYAARAHAARIGAVREAVGVTAYHAREWAVALSELRAVRRMNGTVEHLPLEADCERALGRPDRALELWRSPITQQLDDGARMEMLIVAAGARRDLGQRDAAVVMLQVPDLESRDLREWSARLRYAYADALLEAGRADEARAWFERTLEIDRHDETGASDRLLELDGVLLDDAFDEDPEEDEPDAELDDVEQDDVEQDDVEQDDVEPDAEQDDVEAGVEQDDVAQGVEPDDAEPDDAEPDDAEPDDVAQVDAQDDVVQDEDEDGDEHPEAPHP